MTDRGFAPPSDPYSPHRRTALVLTGTGTAGAYHAGVLRALHEAGVKIDVVAGRGVGVVGALFAAVDGAQRLWDERGFWRGPGARRMYVWLPALRFAVLCLAAAVARRCHPAAVGRRRPGGVSARLRAEAVRRRRDRRARYVRLRAARARAGDAADLAAAARGARARPPARSRSSRPAGATAIAAGSAAPSGGAPCRRRCPRCPASTTAGRRMWDLIRGATRVKRPSRVDLARRYAEMLVENLGQPGFRELFITVHDLDAHRDLVFALVAEARRRDLIRRPTIAGRRRAAGEVFDLTGARPRSPERCAWPASLALPLGTEPHPVTFRGRRILARRDAPALRSAGSLLRLIEELALVDVEQIVLVSAAADSPGPHALAPPRLDGRGRIGEYLQSFEAAAVRDAAQLCSESGPRALHRPAGAQPGRPVRFRRRVRRSVRPAPRAVGADEPRLRGRVPSVHRAGRRRERRTGGRAGAFMKPATESDPRRGAGSRMGRRR